MDSPKSQARAGSGNFRDPWVHAYLADRVIRLLRENNFGYLKIDYNETIGRGCDGNGAPGEGLRQHLHECGRLSSRRTKRSA